MIQAGTARQVIDTARDLGIGIGPKDAFKLAAYGRSLTETRQHGGADYGGVEMVTRRIGGFALLAKASGKTALEKHQGKDGTRELTSTMATVRCLHNRTRLAALVPFGCCRSHCIAVTRTAVDWHFID